VNARDRARYTPLWWASALGHANAVSALLACPGVDVNAHGHASPVGTGETALASATFFPEVVTLLVAAGAIA